METVAKNRPQLASCGGLMYWSEEHVGEDFELMMKLMKLGGVAAYLAYQDGWKEGVTETVHAENKNWAKYMQSTLEMLFKPPKRWLTDGVFAPLIHSSRLTRFYLTYAPDKVAGVPGVLAK